MVDQGRVDQGRVDEVRRETLAVLGTATIGELLPSLAGAQAVGTVTNDIRGSLVAGREPKPLPFDPAKLNGLSEKLVRSHWENNYIGSVKTLNMISERLAAAMKDP